MICEVYVNTIYRIHKVTLRFSSTFRTKDRPSSRNIAPVCPTLDAYSASLFPSFCAKGKLIKINSVTKNRIMQRIFFIFRKAQKNKYHLRQKIIDLFTYKIHLTVALTKIMQFNNKKLLFNRIIANCCFYLYFIAYLRNFIRWALLLVTRFN